MPERTARRVVLIRDFSLKISARQSRLTCANRVAKNSNFFSVFHRILKNRIKEKDNYSINVLRGLRRYNMHEDFLLILMPI